MTMNGCRRPVASFGAGRERERRSGAWLFQAGATGAGRDRTCGRGALDVSDAFVEHGHGSSDTQTSPSTPTCSGRRSVATSQFATTRSARPNAARSYGWSRAIQPSTSPRWAADVGGLRHAGLPTPEVDVAVVDRLHRTAAGKRRLFIPTTA
jgi:hypothetical protein